MEKNVENTEDTKHYTQKMYIVSIYYKYIYKYILYIIYISKYIL